MSEIKCTVCGSEAKHILKGGAVELCQKHFDQKFGKYSHGAEEEEESTPVMDPMELGEPANWTPVDGTPSLKKRKRSESGVFSAPMGYAPDGPKPFYGNRRKLIRDQWGNLRFIRRRKNGTYMDNVDFGRSIRADKQRQAKTWAPPGFRDQGDGTPNLLMRLMGAEGDDEYRYQFVVEVYDTNGEECYGVGGYFRPPGSTIQQAADSARASIFKDMEKEDRRIKKAQSRNKAPRVQATRSVAGARFVTVMEFDDDESDYVEIDADLPADIKLNTAMAAESSPDYNASAYDPLSESATPSGYDPVTFEAPKGKKTKAKKEMTYKQSHNSQVSTTIRTLMHDYDRTGKVGNSSPKNRGAALKQAIAIAYSKTNQTYKRSGKRLPSGVRRAEGEDSDYDASAYDPLSESATPSGYDPESFEAEPMLQPMESSCDLCNNWRGDDYNKHVAYHCPATVSKRQELIKHY